MGEGIIGSRDVRDISELPFPMKDHEDIAFACVVWQDAERLAALLAHVRPYFKTVAVAVQESTDDTLRVAEEYADIVVTDEHRGFGDATFGPKLLPKIQATWTFKVDVDEMPSDDLLGSLPHAVIAANKMQVQGVWIPFKSSIDGVYWNEQHSHLRLFHTRVGWPPSLHSRPPINKAILWKTGFIDHSRTLDEMMQDYLRYYEIGRGNSGWDEHNRLMMRSACLGAAKERGWDYVRSFDWWPDVQAAAFRGKVPMIVFAAGPSCSGTRMLYDKIGELGLKVVHASLPGYFDKKDGSLDTSKPDWWDPTELETRLAKDGEARWVVITRNPEYSAQCAEKRGFISSVADYPDFFARAVETLNGIDGAYRLTYEDFVADPQGEYDKLADWLGVSRREVSAVFDANAKYADEVVPEPEAEPVVEEKPQPKASRRSRSRTRSTR